MFLLATLRCGILELKLVTGRYNETKLEDRLCDICTCNSNEIKQVTLIPSGVLCTTNHELKIKKIEI